MLTRLFRKKVLFGILTALVMVTVAGINYAVGVDGPETRELSLEEAVDLALKNNPDIEIAELSLKKAKVEYDAAQDRADEVGVEYVNTYEAGLLKWVSPKAKEVAYVLAKKNREIAENILKLNVENAYYNVLKAEKDLQIKNAGLKYLQDQLKIAQTSYKVGTMSKLDVTTIEAGVAGYQAYVTSAENTYRTAVMELNRLTGLELDIPLKLTTSFSVEKTGGSVDLDDTIKEALEDDISILSVKKNAELAQVQYETAEKFYVRGVTVYDTAQIDAKIAEASVRKQEQVTTLIIKQSYLTLFTLEKMIDYQEKEVEKARENARIYALKYGAGLATSLDVKKANIDLEEAEQNLSETIYNYNLLKSRFKYNYFSSAAG
ncbi:MAG: hypothetical protein CVU89_05415 [Firmicutes bacterium HGW-Firmicutes-14]|nr:MAG: hypothetical protein CVU89_05415 [Firmicutes bacterium HGW-Firmicutes-14]